MHWDDVRQIMRDTGAPLTHDGDSMIALAWPPPSGRTVHVMAVYVGAIDDLGEWISLGAIVCTLGDTSFEDVADINGTRTIGALVVNPAVPDEPEERRLVTLRQAMRINELQIEEFMYTLKPIVLDADSIRQQILAGASS